MNSFRFLFIWTLFCGATLIFSYSYHRPEISNELLFPNEKMKQSVRIVSYNIRGDNQKDRVEGNSWDIRKYKIQTLMNYYEPDVMGFQEVNISFMPDLEALFPAYQIIAFDITPRDKDAVLLINKKRFTCKKYDSFWLAQDPADQTSDSWGSRTTRIVVYAHLIDLHTNKELFVYCTHFDGYSFDARCESAILLRDQVRAISGDAPSVVTGDFNLFPDEQPQKIYDILCAYNCLHDVRDISQGNHFGPDGTWIGWRYDRSSAPLGAVGARLDNIFLRNAAVVREGVLNAKIIADSGVVCETHEVPVDTPYSSDHLPVIVDIALSKD